MQFFQFSHSGAKNFNEFVITIVLIDENTAESAESSGIIFTPMFTKEQFMNKSSHIRSMC